MTQKEARDQYMRLLKQTGENLSPEERSLAQESFNEGWLQCELNQHQNRPNPAQKETA